MKFLRITSTLATATILINATLATLVIPFMDDIVNAEFQYHYNKTLGTPNDIVG